MRYACALLLYDIKTSHNMPFEGVAIASGRHTVSMQTAFKDRDQNEIQGWERRRAGKGRRYGHWTAGERGATSAANHHHQHRHLPPTTHRLYTVTK
jgi:hypothetical protein